MLEKLHQPLGILDGRSPIEVAKTREGAMILERLLGNIAWGGAA